MSKRIKSRTIRLGNNDIDFEGNLLVNAILQTNANVVIERDYTSLETIQLVSLVGSSVRELRLPNLLGVTYSITIEVPDLQFLDLSALQVVGRFMTINNLTSSVLDLSSLTSIGLSANIGISNTVVVIDLSALVSCESLNISQMNALTTLDLSSLTTMTGNLGGNDNPVLDTVVLNNALDCLDINFAGCALTQTTVDAILLAIDTAGFTGGNLDLSGGTSSAPTNGFSNTNYVNLVNNGWTVNIN
jgi:hypothetical protein